MRLVNSERIILQWDVPFTWPYTTIQHYDVYSNNSAWNQLTYTDTSLGIDVSEQVVACTVYSFTVIANNGLADGQPTTVTGGFPIGKLA